MPNYRRLFIEGTYLFITVITNERKQILVDNIEILRDAFRNTKKNYKFEIYGSVILPDHLHIILAPKNIKEYPKIIHSIKYYFSKNINISNDGGIVIPPYISTLSASKIKKGETGVWQRRYFEHTIRDEEDLYNHLNYIHYNPIKHGYTKLAKDWEYSSFSKFVKMGYYEDDWYCNTNFDEIFNTEME